MPRRLGEAMLRAGVNTRQLQAESGVDNGLISRYLNRKRFHGVAADTVVRLARALGVPPGWLMTGEGPYPWSGPAYQAQPLVFVQRGTALEDRRGNLEREPKSQPAVVAVPVGGQHQSERPATLAPQVAPSRQRRTTRR